MRKFLLLLVLVALAAGCTCTTKTSDGLSPRERELDPIDDFWTVDPYLGETIMLYPVNRILDILDLFSLNVGLGADVQANVHVTRAMQLGLGGAATGRLAFPINYKRQTGVYRQYGGELSFLPLTAEAYHKRNVSSWQTVEPVDYKANGVSEPGRKIYEEARDYYAIGAHVPLVLGSVEAEVHLKEIPDLILGFLMIDLQEDDMDLKTGRNPMEE